MSLREYTGKVSINQLICPSCSSKKQDVTIPPSKIPRKGKLHRVHIGTKILYVYDRTMDEDIDETVRDGHHL